MSEKRRTKYIQLIQEAGVKTILLANIRLKIDNFISQASTHCLVLRAPHDGTPPPSHRFASPPRPPPPSRHTDWISCCSLLPSTTPGMPPTVAVSGARDGSVRIWSRSSARVNKRGGMAGGGGGSGGSGGGGGGKGAIGTGGWSLASCLSGAHGSSEFVTSSACPGGRSGAAAGWVATGGTDWTVSVYIFMYFRLGLATRWGGVGWGVS